MRRVVVVAHKQQSVEGFVGGGEDPQEVAPVAQLEEFFPLSYMARATDSQNIFPSKIPLETHSDSCILPISLSKWVKGPRSP